VSCEQSFLPSFSVVVCATATYYASSLSKRGFSGLICFLNYLEWPISSTYKVFLVNGCNYCSPTFESFFELWLGIILLYFLHVGSLHNY